MTYIYSAPANFSIAKNDDLTYHQGAPTSAPLRSFPPAGAVSTVMMHIPPNPEGNPGFMHRTQTLDHVVLLEGELELSLDGGETRLVKAGEVVVQRACMHSWRNPSKTQGARMFAIAVGSVGAVEGAMEFGGQ
jgi:quercetin dioxygenase-like cupin family protein